MQLRVTRPGFLEGIQKVKAAQGIADYDVNRDATRQEMRAYVCGQCHVEYYFKGPEKRLTYPWDKGLQADEILAYYEENGFKDWTHAETGAPVLKAQHPEFEMWNQGVHARSGVACADCHMPYQRVGAMKISDHHVRSPLLNINRACQTCHRWSEDELRHRVRNDPGSDVRGAQRRDGCADGAHRRHQGREGARRRSTPRSRRRGGISGAAQFLLDFIEAENSMGFHADQEAVRVLALVARRNAPRPGLAARRRLHNRRERHAGNGRSTEIVVPPPGGTSM